MNSRLFLKCEISTLKLPGWTKIHDAKLMQQSEPHKLVHLLKLCDSIKEIMARFVTNSVV